jgi:hypothetical protein
MADFTTRDKVALLKDFLNVVGTETEGVEVKITQDADNGMRFYSEPQVLVDVKNDSGAQIDKGTPVYVSGTHGGSGKPTIEKAKADAAATMPAIGLVLTDLADGDEGYVLAAGTLLNLDTDTPAWDAGDALYVSPTTAGAMTTTRPTGDTELVQKVALVTRRHATAGSVIVMGAGRTNDTPNDSYSGRYDTEAETARSGATTTTEIYYTARPDGDGYAESEVSDVGETNTINRTLFYSDKFDADPDTSADWTQYTTQPASNATFATAKAALLAGLNDTDGTANTRGTLPVSLKMERTVTAAVLLDDYPNALAAFSVRKLRTAYTGNAIRIREGSGNTETDIGFDSNGDLDTAAIASHCGSATGFVVTFYDQSGNGFDATQSTTTAQPEIYDGSAVFTLNGRPTAQFDSNDFVEASTGTISQPIHGFVVTKASTITDFRAAYGDNAGVNRGVSIRPSGLIGTYAGTALASTTAYPTVQALLGCLNDGTGSELSLNGSVVVTGNGGTGGFSGLQFPGINNVSQIPGDYQELVIWDSDQSSNRAGIASNINGYFSIY